MFKQLHYAEVCIQDQPTYHLKRTTQQVSMTVQYDLIDLEQKKLSSWLLRFKGNSPSLDLTIKGFPLLYRVEDHGMACFVSAEDKFPAYYEQSHRSRTFALEEMRFKHIDFQSIIHFTCPEERLVQAIMVANLLFNPILLSND